MAIAEVMMQQLAPMLVEMKAIAFVPLTSGNPNL